MEKVRRFLMLLSVLMGMVATAEPIKSIVGADGIERSGAKPYKHRVEYLESTGTQWIDTRVFPDNYTQTDISFMLLRNNTAYDCIAACEGRGVYYWICARSGGSDRYVLNTSSAASFAIPREFNVFYIVQFNVLGNKAVVNGVQYNLNSVTTTCPNSLILWGENYGKVDFLSIARIYSAIIKDNKTGIVARNFIPVIDWSDEPCMYDEVSGEFFYNKGTGHFIAGPIVE